MRSSIDRGIDLNADLGEGPGEEPLYEVISSANIACGGHAGDLASMREAVQRARRRGVAIGAHPSYPDRAGFGRVTKPLERELLAAAIAAQTGALLQVASDAGATVVHVKPHGALYNDAALRDDVATAVADGVLRVGGALILVGLAGAPALRLWRSLGLRVAAEGFADRAYDADGRLVPRRHAGAVITDPSIAAAQAVRLALERTCDTICLHADTPGASAIALAVRRGLESSGFAIRALPLRDATD
jgi:UPF0271 protein